MNKVQFAFPSYQRANLTLTVDWLEAMGVPADQITISTQTAEEHQQYQDKYQGRATVIYRPGKCVADNRNTLLDHFPDYTRLLLLDDDVSGITILDKAGKKTTDLPANLFLEVINGAFSRALAAGALTWGVYPVNNAYFMSRTISARTFIIGTFMGLITHRNYRFDPAYWIKDDYDYCLQQIKHGRPVMRINYLSVKARHHTKGGNTDHYDQDTLQADYHLITSRYPHLVKGNPRRPYEILMRRE